MNIAIESFSLALEDPLSTAQGTITNREGMLVWVRTPNGAGVGEATPLPGWTESLEDCANALDAVKAVATESEGTVFERLDAGIAACAASPAARHAVSLARADLEATRAGIPLYELYEPDRQPDRVPVNATIGAQPVEETTSAATTAVDRGYDCLKLKVGAQSIDADERRLRAVREAVGSDIELRVDANGRWSMADAEHALQLCEAIGIELLEQPRPSGALEELQTLRASASTVDIALDESLSAHSAAELIECQAADVFVCKPMVLGGPDRTQKTVRVVQKAGLDAIVTTTVDAVVARTAAIHLAATLSEPRACGLATAGRLERDLAADPTTLEGGQITVPDQSGTGVALPDGGSS